MSLLTESEDTRTKSCSKARAPGFTRVPESYPLLRGTFDALNKVFRLVTKPSRLS